MTNQLIEHVADWRDGMTVERATRTLKGIALVGPESRNGYRYAEQALTASIPLYEGRPVFLDHSRDQARSTRDLAGTIRNARFEAGRVRGDIHALDTDSGRTLLALAESNPPDVGMSHVAEGARSADGKTVESITRVHSVDVVIGPATTSSFKEGQHAPPPPPPADATATLRQELAALRQLVEARLGPTSTPRHTPTPTPISDDEFVRLIKDE